MLLQNESLKFLVFAHHLSMLQACTEAVIENKVLQHCLSKMTLRMHSFTLLNSTFSLGTYVGFL